VNRTIWIGDVHGCAPELDDLLAILALSEGDEVVFVGDLVARGPDTVRVLEIARALSAASVRGNHEHRMILAHRARQNGERGPRLSPSHQKVLSDLKEEDWRYLESLPLSLEFPDHKVRVVHAGVVPNLELSAQEAWTLMHIRSLTSLGAASDRYSERSWAADYDQEPHVVFGHNAQAGLQLHPHATGLDTACVYGGRLSALVLEKGQGVPPPAERQACIVSVPARQQYVDFGLRLGKS
jgi:diadenosine tetraphosphatase ApaH/serine/threonine PP2A family protein phosphatase